MQQSRRVSLIESFINVLIGYWIATISQVVIFPHFGIHLKLRENCVIGLWFTLISIIRSYYVRRMFTRMHPWLEDHFGGS